MLVSVSLTFPARTTYAFFDPTGPMQVAYLLKMVLEAYKRYQQLKLMLDQAKNADDYLRLVNDGIDAINGLANSEAVRNSGILGDLTEFNKAKTKVEELYGKVPQNEEQEMYQIHDQTVAESLKVSGLVDGYSKKQEKNADTILSRSNATSPKGAMRLNAQANAQILHTLNQILRINAQILKVQSEQLGYENKMGKDSVEHFNKVKTEMTTGFRKLPRTHKLPQF